VRQRPEREGRTHRQSAAGVCAIPTAANSASKASRLSKCRYTAAALTPSPRPARAAKCARCLEPSPPPLAGRVADLRGGTARRRGLGRLNHWAIKAHVNGVDFAVLQVKLTVIHSFLLPEGALLHAPLDEMTSPIQDGRRTTAAEPKQSRSGRFDTCRVKPGLRSGIPSRTDASSEVLVFWPSVLADHGIYHGRWAALRNATG